MVEGAGLENRYAGNGIVGSNPTLSAVGILQYESAFLLQQTHRTASRLKGKRPAARVVSRVIVNSPNVLATSC